jgi:hypothetical protein
MAASRFRSTKAKASRTSLDEAIPGEKRLFSAGDDEDRDKLSSVIMTRTRAAATRFFMLTS